MCDMVSVICFLSIEHNIEQYIGGKVCRRKIVCLILALVFI
jgi:hypothetical protein